MQDKKGIVIESNKEYHEYKQAISKSRLFNMAKCPQYFKWCEDNPQEPTEAMVFGSALHKWVLEEQDFDSEFAIMPSDIDRRTKEGKERYSDFISQSENKSIITAEQFDIIDSMKKAILSNKYAKQLLKGEKEQSMYGLDELTQIPIKARPDCYRKIGDKIIIVDLKSCSSALPNDFMREVVKYGYDIQAYMYRKIVAQVLGKDIENIDFVFIAVEKKEPYLTNIMQANNIVFQRGEALYRQYIGQYKECLETNNWYGLNGAYDTINELSLPDYLLNIKEV